MNSLRVPSSYRSCSTSKISFSFTILKDVIKVSFYCRSLPNDAYTMQLNISSSPYKVYCQPRTQAQITKNRHTRVFLYRSVAKLSERAGVLGEDARNVSFANPLRPPQAPPRARST